MGMRSNSASCRTPRAGTVDDTYFATAESRAHDRASVYSLQSQQNSTSYLGTPQGRGAEHYETARTRSQPVYPASRATQGGYQTVGQNMPHFPVSVTPPRTPPQIHKAEGDCQRTQHQHQDNAHKQNGRINSQQSHCSSASSPALQMNGQGSHDMHYYGTAAPGKQQKPSFSGRYVPPSMRNRTQQQLSAAPATSQQGRFPVHNGNQQQTSAAPVASQQVEFAVQLFPDMTSLKLAQQTDQHGSLTAFSGRPPPDYHSETAIHDYIAHISPDSAAAFGADVWLDTLHTTVGEFWLPMDKVADFKRMINAACSKLPSVAGIEYTTTELRHSVKRERRKKEIKGIHFYHLGLQASGQLQATLQPWITALQNIAVKIGAKLVLAPFLEHHITIRCHTIEPVPRVVFHQVVQAVHNSPLCIRVAGIRVQLAASVAFERFGAEHVATHIQSDASEVRYPKPAFTSGEAASVLVERAWARQQFGEVQAEAVGVAANIAAAAVADDAAFLASKIQNLSITST